MPMFFEKTHGTTRNKCKIFLSFFLLLFFIQNISGQIFTRIEADFSIKEKSSNSSKLTIGKVYFDKNIRKIVYNISFPEPEIIVINDSLIYRIVNNEIISQKPAFNIVYLSMFNLRYNIKHWIINE